MMESEVLRGARMTSTTEPEPAGTLQFPIFRTCPFAPPEEYRRLRGPAPHAPAPKPQREPAGTLQFPIFRTCPFAPPEEYRRLRDQAAIVPATMPNGDPAWAVTRYAEARQILLDPRISSDTGRPGRPRDGDDRPDEGFFV